jgi:hypothetical protein
MKFTTTKYIYDMKNSIKNSIGICSILFILLLVSVFVFLWKKQTTVIEGGLFSTIETIGVNNAKKVLGIKDTQYAEKKTYTSVYKGDLNPDEVRYKTSTVEIVNDSCSDNFFMNSEYLDDLCSKDNLIIEQKCNNLSSTNCNIPNCCVLLNTNKCVAGDADGPIYKTYNNEPLIYKTYVHRGKEYNK